LITLEIARYPTSA